MKVLFLHQAFPGQFQFLAPELAARGHEVLAFSLAQQPGATPQDWQGVRVLPYTLGRASTPGIHPWLGDLESKVIRGEAVMRLALRLKAAGFSPDVIVAHPGWGEALFLNEVWPRARLGIYCEFYYHAHGQDTGFDPEFPVDDVTTACRLRLKNVNQQLHFEPAHAAISPTHWQAGTYPLPFRAKITVVHDGVDTDALQPQAKAPAHLPEGRVFTANDEVITFVNRNLEPYRGFHVFMRALPEILRRRPHARVCIVGADGVGYGAAPTHAPSWRALYESEARARIPPSDWSRAHFLGLLPYPALIALLRVSRAHVYWTYPFVLSWSLLEAMSLGCTIVASDTAPVREAIRHGETGRLVDFFDAQALCDEVCALLEDRALALRLGHAARADVRERYDLHRVCLPRQIRWVDDLAAAG